MFKIGGRNAWGNCWESQGTLNLRCYATATLWHPNYDKITYSREKKTKPNRRIWERSEKIIQHPLFPVQLFSVSVCVCVCVCVCVQVCLHACAEKSKEKSVFFGVCQHCTHRQRRAEIILTNRALPLSSPTHPPHPTQGLRLAPQMVSHTTPTFAHSFWHVSQKKYTRTNISHISGSLPAA